VTSLDLLSKYLLIMELRFNTMLLYSNLGNEKSDAAPKRSRGPQVPHPWFTLPLL